MWNGILSGNLNVVSIILFMFVCFGFKSPTHFHKHWTEKSTSLFRQFYLWKCEGNYKIDNSNQLKVSVG